MEGLLPLVYKAIKKRKTRRQYQCLSSGAALSYSMNVAEFYPQTQGHDYYLQEPSTSILKEADDHTEKIGHLRYNSVRNFSNGFSSPQQRTRADGSPASKHIVRFRSHKMFSCFAWLIAKMHTLYEYVQIVFNSLQL
ncbi:hypothetical protein E2542_SST17608 [Spatholobus suberectus]|nr:hypothetical protein E2542_SST17608 [Spatholobus suberectus]